MEQEAEWTHLTQDGADDNRLERPLVKEVVYTWMRLATPTEQSKVWYTRCNKNKGTPTNISVYLHVNKMSILSVIRGWIFVSKNTFCLLKTVFEIFCWKEVCRTSWGRVVVMCITWRCQVCRVKRGVGVCGWVSGEMWQKTFSVIFSIIGVRGKHFPHNSMIWEVRHGVRSLRQ